ncbi:hypothetical protein FNF29_06260 [Cafeteria roenbergensis]|uniref:Uncharacterized protein n=1 Tax=Cafeteria roenbergensis TaxID=33653 RepID=A0A5A8C7B4_CAFRO|nr:hypothetical protein FNF29_06260 [Cafeteria roenbergensis]|eukprot:KAA0148976.1 hypothetical protein FNF29_06260 [Cafeteria roenbergensis]
MAAASDATDEPQDTVESLEAERTLIEQGTHPTLRARARVFEHERQARADKADLERQWKVKVANEMAQAEINAAAQAFDASIASATSKLLKELDSRLAEIRASGKGAPTRGAFRALRSKVKEANDASASGIPGCAWTTCDSAA